MKMNKHLLNFIFLFTPILMFCQLRFECLALDNYNNFLFRSSESGITTSNIPETSLFYGKLRSETPEVQAISFRPEHLVYSKNSECVFIQNRLGIFVYMQNGNAIKALPNIPNFLSGEEYSIYDLCKIAISPNGRYLLYKKAVSPTRADIFLYDLTSAQPALIVNSADRCPGETVAKWSHDSTHFIYQKNNKIYYFSIANYLQNRQLEESWRFIADARLVNGEWTDGNNFIWAEKDAIWECDTASFAAKSIYSNYLQQGKAAASLPYPFRQQSHRMYFFGDFSQMLLVRDNGAAMLFSPNATLESNAYLQLGTNMRVKKAEINQNGSGAILVKVLENGNFTNKLFLIKNKNFVALSDELTSLLIDPNDLTSQINDFTLDDKTLLISTSAGGTAINIETDEILWQTELKDVRKILPVTTGHILFAKDVAWQRSNSGNLKPLFLCGAPAAGISDNGTPIITASKGNVWEIDVYTGMIKELPSYQGKIITEPHNDISRLLTREIKKSFYQNIVCFKETSNGKQIDIIKEGKLNYTLYQPEIKGDIRFKAGEKYEVALLFDCLSSGEGIFEIAEALKQYKIRANFFLNGDFIRNQPILTREISLLDAEIGNLFDSNINFSGDTFTIDKTFIQQGLSAAEEKYFAITGKNFAPYWHSPLFIYNTSIVQYGLDSGYKFVSFQLDSMDWIDKNDRNVNSRYYMNNEKLILRLMKNLNPSQTVLFSTGFNGTERDEWLFENISTILCEMQRSGYTFSYVSSILNRYRK